MGGRKSLGPLLWSRRDCARDPFSWDATNKSVRFTVGNVSRPGFWRHWGVWGDRSPRSAIRGRGAGRGIEQWRN